MKLKYLNRGYVTQGELKGFPLEIIDRMIECQTDQGNGANIRILDDCLGANTLKKRI